MCRAPYTQHHPHQATTFHQPTNLCYFPNLPQYRGRGKYAADRQKTSHPGDSCRKASYSHPSLSPGIFTLFCPHGICLGYEVMQSCESPMHPFNIFKQRFRVAPQVIVYDNAELHSFAKTLFTVDRFHWHGHTGCSSGYNLSMYKTMSLKEINSQVKEQVNAGLQRIRKQLAYMLPENFMFTISLFFSLNKSDIIRKLDVQHQAFYMYYYIYSS